MQKSAVILQGYLSGTVKYLFLALDRISSSVLDIRYILSKLLQHAQLCTEIRPIVGRIPGALVKLK